MAWVPTASALFSFAKLSSPIATAAVDVVAAIAFVPIATELFDLETAWVP